VVVIGSGPAGLAAAIYASRRPAGHALVITDNEIGGQLSSPWTSRITGFKGRPCGNLIQGHAGTRPNASGLRSRLGYVTEIDFSQRPFRLKTHGSRIEAQALIVTTGSPAQAGRAGRAGVCRQGGLLLRPTCDGSSSKDKDIVVSGGGRRGGGGAVSDPVARTVTLIHRRDRLRASPSLQNRATDNPR